MNQILVYCVLDKSLELLRRQQLSIMQQFGASAFYTVVCWHKQGEVDTEYTSDFHLPRVPQPASKNNPACEIMSENVVEILSIDVFCLKFRFYVSFCIDLLCWIIFVVSKIFGNLHFRPIL